MTRDSHRGESGDDGRRKQLTVVSSAGEHQRFLRGMITHDLVQRGMAFDEAYAVARRIREQLAGRETVTTGEIKERIRGELVRTYGPDLPRALRAKVVPRQPLRVRYHGQVQPFSRGLLARSIQAAGIDLDHAYRLAEELVDGLLASGAEEAPSGEIARRVGDLLEQKAGESAARRYRMIRRVRRLPHPLVIYLGGASGTGKSTLALELAPLLRIYRVNATDTIRQVMRMVFTPSILPALHSSSFEVIPPHDREGHEIHPPGLRDLDLSHRLVATYEEQAARVCVGVRAVVERAIAENMSILVEGVHLHPALIPFPDLEGSAYQVPLFLATLSEEAHRSRFVARARSSNRPAERYLENFASIRLIQEQVLHKAESLELPILDTSDGEPPVEETLRIITGILELRHPSLATAGWRESKRPAPALMLIIDGLADRPVRALGGRTPLQAAATPTLDRLAREGRSGLADPVAPGVVPDTAAGGLALFGQSPLALKRGPVEALGAGLELLPDDVALRGNFASLDDRGQVVDRRAGRIRERAEELARAIDRLQLPGEVSTRVEVLVRVSTEHRLAVVLRGEGLSSAIQGSDPGDGAPPGPPLVPQPLDPEDERAAYTASVLAVFEQEARRILADHPVNRRRTEDGLPPANAVITRGAGRIHRLVSVAESGVPLNLTCVSGDHTILGLARWLGAETVTSPEMTANLDTDLGRKFTAALEALQHSDLVVLHLKGADIAAHDRRPDLKTTFLERIDRHLGELLCNRSGPLRIAVASDHATLSEIGQHAADPLPVLIWGDGVEPDEVEAFDEQTAPHGGLQRFPLQLLLGRLLERP